MNNIIKTVGKTIKHYDLIQSGDRILLGFSGGKDSFALLDILLKMLKKSPMKFEIIPAIVDQGNTDVSIVGHYFDKIDTELIVERTSINKHVKEIVKKGSIGNRCYICSKLRRGVLAKLAKENKCNKIALGHNLDDAVETFLLNMLYVSKPDVMRPLYVSGDLTMIKPLIEVPEMLITKYSKDFPLIPQTCEFEKEESRRERIKEFISEVAKDNPHVYPSILNSLRRLNRKID